MATETDSWECMEESTPRSGSEDRCGIIVCDSTSRSVSRLGSRGTYLQHHSHFTLCFNFAKDMAFHGLMEFLTNCLQVAVVEAGPVLTQIGSTLAWWRGWSNGNRGDKSLRCDTSVLGNSRRCTTQNYSYFILVLTALEFKCLRCLQLLTTEEWRRRQTRSPHFDLEPETRLLFRPVCCNKP